MRIGVRAWALGTIAVALFGMTGCRTPSTPLPPSTQNPPAIPRTPPAPPAPAAHPPIAPDLVPDAVPRVEPRSAYGNPPFYEVFGRRYYVLPSSVGYVERGVASWYGPGFHEVRTSAGEPYDMYGMTAAHKTLPLPAYARVINLQNGRSVVVRINDRGPFVGNRIIDLSYTAAAKLDMLRSGTAIVEVRAIDPTAPAQAPESIVPSANALSAAAPGAAAVQAAPTVSAPLYIQAGAFADPANAERLVAKLRGGGYGSVFVRKDAMAGRAMYRVRIGPIADVPEFDRVVAALERAGLNDARLALE